MSNLSEPSKVHKAQIREDVDRRTRTLVTVPVIGRFLPGPGDRVALPDAPTLVYAGTLVGLAAFEVIEWPVSIGLAVAHMMSQQRSKSTTLDAVEEALDTE